MSSGGERQRRAASDDYVEELKKFTRERLSQHEFPRHIAFVAELPKTPAGKVNRKVLRDREAAAAPSAQPSEVRHDG